MHSPARQSASTPKIARFKMTRFCTTVNSTVCYVNNMGVRRTETSR